MTVSEAKAFLKMAGWRFISKRGGRIDLIHPELLPHGTFFFLKGYKRACEDVLRRCYGQQVFLEDT